MKFFPESALHQLEFDKIKDLLAAHCRTEYAKATALQLRIHTKIEFIETALQQANEFKIILQGGEQFPNEFVINISKELKLLAIAGASLTGEQFLLIRGLLHQTAPRILISLGVGVVQHRGGAAGDGGQLVEEFLVADGHFPSRLHHLTLRLGTLK